MLSPRLFMKTDERERTARCRHARSRLWWWQKARGARRRLLFQEKEEKLNDHGKIVPRA